MKHVLPTHRQQYICLALCVFFLVFPSATSAQESATYVLRPHCDEGYDRDNSPFGIIPAPAPVVETGETTCRFFDVLDPQTLTAGPFGKDDIVDLDIVIQNPDKKKVSSARVWLDYDPQILEGVEIAISDRFPVATPGESVFSELEGQVKINVSAEDDGPDFYWTRVANVKFRVKETITDSTVVSFFNVQPGGHTFILSGKESPEDILGSEPGSLLVSLGKASAAENGESGDAPTGLKADGESCNSNEECINSFCYDGICRAPGFTLPNGESCERDNQCQSLNCSDGVCSDAALPNGSACASNSDCQSNFCLDGICSDSSDQEIEDEDSSGDDGGDDGGDSKKGEAGDQCSRDRDCESDVCIDDICTTDSGKVPVGGSCIVDFQCESMRCEDGLCQPEQPDSPPIPNQNNTVDQSERTAFGLLKIRGVRITTEDDSVFLGWDPLASSRLASYNIYYGTTEGEYIQRKTVPGTDSSVTIRSLPKGTQYYFAIRGVSSDGEETAFSDEVSVVVGDPDSSSAPLVASVITDSPNGEVPIVQPIRTDEEIELPGETGIPSIAALFVIISAIVGTIFAARRQIVAISP